MLRCFVFQTTMPCGAAQKPCANTAPQYRYPFLQTMLLRGLVIVTLLVNACAMSLTKANFASEVLDSGKNAFVKFQAPW